MTWSGNKQRESGRQHYRRTRYYSTGDASRRSPSPKQFEDRKSLSEFTSRTTLSLRISPIPSGSSSDSGLSRSPSPQGTAYAGAKFNDPPLPKFLPKPPSHWMLNFSIIEPNNSDVDSHLKKMLKVSAQLE